MLTRRIPRETEDSYKADILENAEAICDGALGYNASQPHLLYARGLLLKRTHGHVPAAVACLMRACTLEPSSEKYHVALGDALFGADRHPEALSAYLKAMRLSPDSVVAYLRLGRVLCRLRQPEAASVLCREALRLDPHHADAHLLFGVVLQAMNRLPEATSEYEAALQSDSECADAYHRLGRIWMARRHWDRARAAFQNGLRVKPGAVDLHVGEGEALFGLAAFAEAGEAFRRALAMEPTHIRASRGLVRALKSMGNRRELASAWYHFGTLLQNEQRYEEAARAYGRSLDLEPTSVRARAGLVHAWIAGGRTQEAAALAAVLVAETPHDLAAHSDLSTVYHLLGDTERGWDECVWYYAAPDSRRHQIDAPLWDGSLLDGRTILLWTDMGRGDVIQFLRYIADVKACGGRIVVQCHHSSLRQLVARIPEVDRVVSPGAVLPHIDVHAPLNFFPAFYPQYRSPLRAPVPYLTIDPMLVQSWQRKVGKYPGLTIGLSWGGNAATVSAPSRFVSLATFTPLRSLPGVRFISLQHGPQAEELLEQPCGLSVMRVLDASSSIADAAALVCSVDLVISVETMIAHLAGALGRPVWTLLRYATNWRWQATGNRTSWYPTMRLFRQPHQGDWTSVIADVLRAARDLRPQEDLDIPAVLTAPYTSRITPSDG